MPIGPNTVPGWGTPWWESPAPQPLPIVPSTGTGRAITFHQRPAEEPETDDAVVMMVSMIWVRDGNDPDGVVWLYYSEDEDTLSDDEGSRFDKKFSKAVTEYGAENVRVVKTRVDYNKVLEAFEAPEV